MPQKLLHDHAREELHQARATQLLRQALDTSLQEAAAPQQPAAQAPGLTSVTRLYPG